VEIRRATPSVLVPGLLLIFLPQISAQLLSFGVIGGVPLTDAVQGNFGGSSESHRYTVGPALQLRLSDSFRFEANALYKRLGYSASQSDGGVTVTGQAHAHSLEFPFLVKYDLPSRRALPFAGVGYVFRNLVGVKGSARLSGSLAGGTPIDTTFPVPASTIVRNDPTHGLVVGTGVRLRTGPFRMAPEFRYTRWSARPFDDEGPRGFVLQSSRNQVELLLGLIF
jgi:hypothetical protein